MSLESQLIEIFKSDIESILSHIGENENEMIYSFIKDIEFEGYIYYISFELFEDLVNRYCFNIWESNPMERTIPDDRLSLFRKIFLENVDFSTRRVIFWYRHSAYYSEGRLYLLLFYHLFTERIYTQNPIERILNQALNEWKSALSIRKMPIKVFLILSDTNFKDDRKRFLIADDIELVRPYSYVSLTGFSRSQVEDSIHNFHSISLILSTSQSFDHNFYGEFSEKVESMSMFKGEYQEILNKIRYFMLSFYLNGNLMIRKDVEIFTPWWIQEDFKEFKTSNIHIKDNKLELNDLNQLKNLFNKNVEFNLFQDRELDLILFNYNELHKKTLISELILYDFIILENIFTRGSTTEVTFRLSLNLALFISESKEEFQKIFQISKKLYGIRSAIIHGENWSNKLRKKKFPEQLGLKSNTKEEELARAVHEHLLNYINKAVKKVIQLKIDQIKDNKCPEIMKDFKDLYFLLNSKVVKI